MKVNSITKIEDKSCKSIFPVIIQGNTTKVKYRIEDFFNVKIIKHAYEGKNMENNKDAIIKFISEDSYFVIQDMLPILKNQTVTNSLLLKMFDVDFYNEPKYYYLAMDGSKINLQELSNFPDKIPFITAHCIAIKMLLAIEFLHLHGFIHNNIQMSSFWLSNYDDEKFSRNLRVFLSDYEYSYKNDSKKSIIKSKEYDFKLNQIYARRSKSLSKNLIYCPLNHHKQQKSTMKSDLESWFYIFIHLLEKDLPWKNYEYDEYYIQCQKEEIRKPNYYFFSNTHERLAQCIVIIDEMDENKLPDYKLFRGKILRVIRNFNLSKQVIPQYSERTRYIEEAEKHHYLRGYDVEKSMYQGKTILKTKPKSNM